METEEIIKKAEQIEKAINSYYEDRKVVILSDNDVRNITAENLNQDKNYDHPYINIILNDSEEINACAYKYIDQYFVEINTGVFSGIKEYVHSIVTRKVFENVKEIGCVIPSRIESLITEDCYAYLYLHEFFHITNGHCDLVKKLQLEKLSEVSNKIGVEPKLVRQTLEYDADCCAIASMLNEQLRSIGMLNKHFGDNSLRMSVDSLVQTMSHILISIFIINSQFYEVFKKANKCSLEDTINFVERLDHPLPGMRVMYMMLNMNCIIEQSGIYSEDETIEIFERTFDSLISFVEIYKDIVHPELLKVAITDKGIKHLQKVHDNWEKVVKEIPIAYGTLAPYTKCDYGAILKGE